MKLCLGLALLAGHGASLAGAVAVPFRGAHPFTNLDQVEDHAHSHADLGFLTGDGTTTYFVYGVVAVLVLAVLGFAAWGMAQKFAARSESGDDKSAREIDPASLEAPPLAVEASASAEVPLAEPLPAASKKLADKKIDLEHFLQLLAKRTVHQVGPKITKANNVRGVLMKHIGGFRDKALGFLGNELMGTLAQLLREADAEEVMLLLNPQESLAANIPPLSIMLAGLMSPMVLTISLIIHLSQVFLVLIPVMVMCIVSLWVDGDTINGCAVPTLWFWVYFQGVLAAILIVAHMLTVVQIHKGKASIQEKVKEMQGRLNEALADGELSVSEMRELFVIITILLEHSLVVEDGLRQSPWRKIIGYGTMLWIGTTVWTFIIVLGWTFIPGVVAFAKSAAKVAGGSFCGAWASVLSARLSCVLSLFFLLFNMLSVLQFVSDTLIMSEAWSAQWLSMAKSFDDSMLGLPVVQTLVKAFLLRGTADTLRAQIAVAKNRDKGLELKREELQGKIEALKGRIAHHKAEAETLKGSAGSTTGGAIQKRVSDTSGLAEGIDVEALAALGDAFGGEATAQAKALEAATKEELEQLYAKIVEAVTSLRNQSANAMEQAQQEMEKNLALAQAAATEGLSSAEAAAREAAGSGSESAAAAAARAQQYAGEAQDAASRAREESGRCRQA